jgi:hypothetical protein
VHFDHANNWGEGHDIDSKMLDREQFAMAYKTLVASEAREQVTESQIDEDFALLDKSGRGLVGFMEVSQYCSKYLHTAPEGDSNEKASKLLGINGNTDDTMKELLSGPRQYYDSADTESKTDRAVDALAAKLDNIKEIAKQVGEQTIQKGPETSIEPVQEEKVSSPKAFSEKLSAEPKSARKPEVEIDTTDKVQSPKSSKQTDPVDSQETKSVSPRISPTHGANDFNVQVNKSPRVATPLNDQRVSPRGNPSPKNNSSTPKGNLSPNKSNKSARGFSSSPLAKVAEN